MMTSVNRNSAQKELTDILVKNAFTGGIDFTQYFSNRLYYIDAKAMFSSLHGSPEAILHIKKNPTHYYHRQSGDYLDLNPSDTKLQGTGGYLKAGKRGNEQWNFSQIFNWSSPGLDRKSVV